MNAFLDYASSKYYAGVPVISDEEFDKLAEYYDYKGVGAAVIGDSISHAFPMWSLDKIYESEDTPPVYKSREVKTSKLDGAAISITYCFGNLVLGLTRGDGKAGKDATANIRTLVSSFVDDFKNLPVVQVTGEVVAPTTVKNARNYSAGALGLNSVEEFKTRTLTFIAYGLFPYKHSSWSLDMEYLQKAGFKTVTCSDWTEFPHDGIVVRIDNYSDFEELGYTSKHPRGAYAIKHRKGGVLTRLIDVEWQVGRSGIISPVGILEPVEIGGATITRATLHNINNIRELNLDIGCLVEVERAGEIIPRVIRRVDEQVDCL